MKKIVYIALTDCSDQANGVARKIKMQINGMEQNGAEVECIAFGQEGICIYKQREVIPIIKCKDGFSRRIHLLKAVLYFFTENKADVVYMRFAYSDPMFCHVLKKIRKHVDRIIVEIPTYPYKYKGTFFRSKKVWFMNIVDQITFKRMSRYIDKYYVVGAPVDRMGNVTAVNIPNGIVEGGYKKKKFVPGNTVHIICVAAMYAYQGYDRLLCGLKNYMEKQGKRIYKVHLVGDGPEISKYREIVETCALQDYVIFHGEMKGPELDDLFDICDIACASLAPHRRQIVYSSPLKGKEYMLRGIPYIYSYKEIGIPEEFPYLYYIPSEETPIDMVQFEKFYENYEMHKQEYSNYLHNYALEHFDWKNILADL